MVPVRVVLDRGSAQVELGPFNQGIVIDGNTITDIASRVPILYQDNAGCWKTANGVGAERVWIQAIDEAHDGS